MLPAGRVKLPKLTPKRLRPPTPGPRGMNLKERAVRRRLQANRRLPGY